MDEAQRITFVIDLVRELSRYGRVGKTHVQKATYFAQEAAHIDLGFKYVIHHYGPFSFDLDSFLQRLASQGTLEIQPDEDGYGYMVSVAEDELVTELDETVKGKVERIAAHLGGLSTRELELKSTAYYIQKRLPDAKQDAWVREVRSLKPRFSEIEVTRAIKESQDISQAVS